ncbi:heavy metal sensor histidine kinase [Azoarcus sp. KH32C]|uniref:heavy metal sensor histidine kinase n=1 Tax=Azoarcus sp. KH32C TaxID=748247 RepID=UPI0002386084|nr:heavy metal sensor histidine kinase [Azoarcus sp. KH32C]BAL26198.1 two-component system, OmpR family, heavy metal sensor histidine kinase CusS [Azoarcus sp. KH32C]
MPRLSLTLRLTLLFGSVCAAVLLGLGAFISLAVERHFEEGDLVELHGKLELVRSVLAQVRGEDDFAGVAQQLDTALVGHHSLSIAVVRDGGEILFASSGGGFPAQLVREVSKAQAYPGPHVWEQDGHVYRGIVAAAPTGVAGAPDVRVVVSMDIEHHRAFMREFTRSLWLAVALAIVATSALGAAAARGGLAPLRKMAAVAGRISASRLHERIAVEALPGELRALGAEFNAMMARLEEGFRRLSEFSSDIAHELRTPVSNLMTQTQVALGRVRSADEYREVLLSNLEEYERLARMVADMLFLAQADNGLLPRPAETLSLADEAHALVDFYEALAEEKGVRLMVTGDARVPGDRLMLRRAISNLLSNALRHTAAGAAVTIAIDIVDDGMARLAVANPGDTIPAEHLSRLFERFHRVDPSRTRQGDGAGLGLAITRSIVEAHGGRVVVASMQGLTTFSLYLPLAAPGAGEGRTSAEAGKSSAAARPHVIDLHHSEES